MPPNAIGAPESSLTPVTGSEALLGARSHTEDGSREQLHGAQPYWREEARTKGFSPMTKTELLAAQDGPDRMDAGRFIRIRA